MPHSDEEIIELLSSKDPRANDRGIELVYQFFFPMITKLILKNSGTKEDVEEVFQDAALVLFVKCQEDNLDLRSKLKTYFYSICRNIWLKALRRRKLTIVDIQDMEEDLFVEVSFFHLLELDEERKVMLKLIEKLGFNCQQLLELYYYERLRMKEIAKRMNYANDQVVRNKKAKCLKRLCSFLDNSPLFKELF